MMMLTVRLNKIEREREERMATRTEEEARWSAQFGDSDGIIKKVDARSGTWKKAAS
jgi:hypothetical protein